MLAPELRAGAVLEGREGCSPVRFRVNSRLQRRGAPDVPVCESSIDGTAGATVTR